MAVIGLRGNRGIEERILTVRRLCLGLHCVTGIGAGQLGEVGTGLGVLPERGGVCVALGAAAVLAAEGTSGGVRPVLVLCSVGSVRERLLAAGELAAVGLLP